MIVINWRVSVYASGFGWLTHSDWYTRTEARQMVDRLSMRPLLARIQQIEVNTTERVLSHTEIVK
jgi:hypothetical protein